MKHKSNNWKKSKLYIISCTKHLNHISTPKLTYTYIKLREIVRNKYDKIYKYIIPILIYYYQLGRQIIK